MDRAGIFHLIGVVVQGANDLIVGCKWDLGRRREKEREGEREGERERERERDASFESWDGG